MSALRNRADDPERPPATGRAEAAAVLRPGETCWRIERAERAAFLIDAMDYFSAAKAAMRQARRSILIIGWDFEPRIRFEPHRDDAVAPDVLGDLLAQLVAERPDLHVGVLRWDMPLPLSFGQHPKTPLRWRQWTSDERLQYRLDSLAPVGAAQHQKLLVVDDALAFCGGIDLAGDRWDRPGHPDGEPLRATPDGFSYESHHDVMLAVDGPAAAALGALARERWRRATGEAFAGRAAEVAPWPEGLEPHLRDVDVGIARTEPAWYSRPPVRENEALFLRSIAAARRSIYLESQYVTAKPVIEALARRLGEPDGPEVVLVVPHESPGWFDRLAMDSARQAAIELLRGADRFGRLGIYSPFSPAGRPIVVHSKLSIIDERFVRVGTANLNNRSLGFDTECDLALEGTSRQADAVSRAARWLRDSLLAEHLGVSREAMGAALAEAGGLIPAIETLRSRNEGRLRPAQDNPPFGIGLPMTGASLLDPADPEHAWWLAGRRRPRRRPLGGMRLVLALAGLAAAGVLAGRWLTRRGRSRSGS